MTHICDCGRAFSDLNGIEVCQNTNHGLNHTNDKYDIVVNLLINLITAKELNDIRRATTEAHAFLIQEGIRYE